MNYAQTIRTGSRSQRVHELCLNLKNKYQATKLWNWIDNQMDSYELWGVMLDAAPWAFDDPEDPNSIRFVYDRDGLDNTLCFRLEEEHRKIERKVKRAAKTSYARVQISSFCLACLGQASSKLQIVPVVF